MTDTSVPAVLRPFVRQGTVLLRTRTLRYELTDVLAR